MRLRSIITEHIHFSESYILSLAEWRGEVARDEDDDEMEVAFPLFAEEVWLVPVPIHTFPGKFASSLKAISAKCRTMHSAIKQLSPHHSQRKLQIFASTYLADYMVRILRDKAEIHTEAPSPETRKLQDVHAVTVRDWMLR